jgi:hypothetical protein
MKRNYMDSEASPKVKALLRIASMVQMSGREISGQAVESAKKEGSSEMNMYC